MLLGSPAVPPFLYRFAHASLASLVITSLRLHPRFFDGGVQSTQVAIRNIRREAVDAVKKAEKAKNLGKDQVRRCASQLGCNRGEFRSVGGCCGFSATPAPTV